MQSINRQHALLLEGAMVCEMRDLAAEALAAERMITAAKTDQARLDSILYAEQIFDEIDDLERKIHRIRQRVEVRS